MRSSVLVVFFLVSNNTWSMDQQKDLTRKIIQVPSLKGKLPFGAAVIKLESSSAGVIEAKLESPLVDRIRKQSVAEKLQTEQVCKEAKGGSAEVVAKV